MKYLSAPQFVFFSVEIDHFEHFGQKKPGTLREALIAGLSDDVGDKKAKETRADVMLAKLEKCGFPINFVMKSESVDPKNGRIPGGYLVIRPYEFDGRKLTITDTNGKTYILDLFPLHFRKTLSSTDIVADEAQLAAQIRKIDFFGARKGWQALKTELEDKKVAGTLTNAETRKEFDKLCDREILLEVRKAFNLPVNFSARAKDWKNVLPQWDGVVASLKAHKGQPRINKLTAGGTIGLDAASHTNYTGSPLQNLLFIEYYRLNKLR